MSSNTPSATTNNDPDVVLPRAVRRAAQRANELHAEMHGEQPGNQPETDPSITVIQEEDGADQPRLPLGDQPTEPSQTQQPGDSWEQRYRSLQGKYDSEIPALRAQVTSLERLIGTMQSPPAPPPQAQPDNTSYSLNIPEEDVQEYGPELIAASRRWAAAEFGGRLTMLQGEIERLKGTQTQQTEAQLRDRVQSQLDGDPDLGGGVWRRLNNDPGFLNWLQELDPLAGVPRNVMLQHAYSGGDAVRTGMFFKAYIAEHTSPYPAGSTTGQTVRPNGQAPAAGRRLEDMASPGRAAGRGAGNGATAEKRVWTNREISQFYRERTDGKWNGREAEATTLEADILAAGAEGRVRNV